MENLIFNKKTVNHNSFSEDILIQNSIKGSKESFISLIDLYKEYLYKTAFLYVKNEQDAIDIYQDTIYKSYISITKLKNPKYFKTWLTRILINTAQDKLKQNSKELLIYNKENSMINNECFDMYCNIEDKIDLYDAIDNLKAKYKTAIILKYIHDLSIKNISEIMNCSENTVKSYIHRAKKHLLGILRR